MTGHCPDATVPSDGAVELVRFVRETLGCGCPDDVLARIAVDVSEDGEPGLDVGGRLLVRVLSGQDLDHLIETFPATVERLSAERDRRGFNRLRMVVARPAHGVIGEILGDMLGAMTAADGRVFLHVAETGELPTVLNPVVCAATPRPES